MPQLPYMKIFWPELLADCSHMSLAELGLYLACLGRMWLSEDGAISETVFERLAAQPTELDVAVVREKLFENGAGLTQKRLQKERLSALDTSRKRSEAGAKGGSAKPGLSPAQAKTKPGSHSNKQLAISNKQHKQKQTGGAAPPARSKRIVKINIGEYEPDEADREYAEQHGWDPDVLLQEIKDWAVDAAKDKVMKKDPKRAWQRYARTFRKPHGQGPQEKLSFDHL